MIDERLKKDTTLIGESQLSELRLMHDAELDWVLIIPKREVKELIELEKAEQDELWREIITVSSVFKSSAEFDKLNIGALGNMVSQLHIHVIARKKNDRAWPGAIWGTSSKDKFNSSKIKFWKDKFSKTSFAI